MNEDRFFQIHLTRSHMGELVIAAADTGRHFSPPKSPDRLDPWLEECSWRTRFDGGLAEIHPSTVVAIYASADFFHVPSHQFRVFQVAGLVVQHYSHGTVRRYFRHCSPASLTHWEQDGLVAIRELVMRFESYHRGDILPPVAERREPWGLWEPASNFMSGTKEILHRATDMVMSCFGQGKEFFKV